MIDLFPLTRPLLHALPPETAHRATLLALRAGLAPRPQEPDDPILRSRLWGLDFPNPVGLAAGFDKNAEAPDALLRSGFGFVELGTVTPRPQPGNPKPRLFRLPDQGALVNRMGFNNDGLAAVAARLARRAADTDRCSASKTGRAAGPVGVNLGRNKDRTGPDEAAEDYRAGVLALAGLADYLVINVSSPNTPGLRALQGRAPLEALLAAVLAARAESGHAPPLLLKIAPDLGGEDLEDIAAVALAAGIDGLIVTNTTIARPPGLPPRLAAEAGGLSGRPLAPLALATLRAMARLTGGRLPLVAVGGIADGAEAYARLRAGASLVQLYTALVYCGPRLIAEIKRDLAARLRADGFTALGQAVGADR